MRHIRLVAALSSHGSVTAAARALSLSQSALSHQLRELETQLRTPLYVRTRQRMVPTAAGERLLALVADVAKELHRFEHQALSGRFDQDRAEVGVAVESYTSYHWLPEVLEQFRERWPGIDIQIRPEFARDIPAGLRDGAVDLALVYSQPADPRIQTQHILDDCYVVVTSPRHALQALPFVPLDALEQEHLLVSTASEPVPILDDVMRPAGVEPRLTTFVPLTETLIELAAADIGVAVLPQWVARPALESGKVKSRPLTELGVRRSWYVASRRDDPTTEYRERLIELLRCSVAGLELDSRTLKQSPA